MKDLKISNRSSREDRLAIDVAFTLLDRYKVKKTTLGQGRVDDFLIKRGQEGIFIATLDNGIKRKIPKKIVIFKAQNKVGVDEGA